MFFRGPAFANVTSVLALVVACGGTAYATATITSAAIVDRTIRGEDLQSGTITAREIADGSIQRGDLASDLHVLSASSGEECKLTRRSPGVKGARVQTSAAFGLSVSTCVVRFTRNVSRCTAIASGGGFVDTRYTLRVGGAETALDDVSPFIGNDEVRIRWEREDPPDPPDPPGTVSDYRPPTFHLAVFCPRLTIVRPK